VTINVYDGQDHAFARRGGDNYSAAAAELANRRTADFFAEHLAA
jgi:carboxymethylenebutenolidase